LTNFIKDKTMSFILSPGSISPPLTAGGVVYGTGPQALVTSAGTAGEVLTSAGAGAPTWATPASGAMTLVSSATASSSSYIIFTGLDYTVYKEYMIIVSGVIPSQSGYALCMQMSNDNGATYKTGANAYYFNVLFLGNPAYNNTSTNEAYIAFSTPGGLDSTSSFNGMNLNIYLNSLTKTSHNGIYYNGFAEDVSFGGAPIFGGGQLVGFSGPINAVRFFINIGRLLSSGTFKLYGIT